MKSDKSFWHSEEGLRLVRGWTFSGLAPWQIARKTGMTSKAFQTLANEQPALAAALMTTGEHADLMVEEALLCKALTGDVRACSYWLKNRKGQTWADTPHQHMEETHTTNQTIATLVNLLQSSHEERDIEEFV